MMELADMRDLKSLALFVRVGSTPTGGTKFNLFKLYAPVT